jgi:glycosyltransferase involved in cell wall biosynthesis
MGILNQVKGQIPLVVESHSLCRAYKFEVSGRVKTIIEKLYSYQVRKAQLLVALTYGDANDWMKITRNVVVIPNFVHLNNSGKYSDLKSKKALFVGRFSKQKDIGILFKIWEVVNQKHSDWQLHIYGGYGDDYEQLMYKYKKTSSCVIIHEPTPMIFDAYLNSSMLLLTSVYEPFGLVLPEAMSCGLPVISFNCPYGPSDIIKDGIDGFLVKERNVLEYANRVCQLIENSSLRTRMGQAAAVTSQRYRADLIMPIWKQLFEKL